ncbi:hypothetical protein [Microbacterium sp. MYb62]|uniref:hypothetical protein n=1 Tax=Microbacterium sp. MYb62 TaxID=1848690 RepID=UPI000CFAAA91|nr:hypothetical protein [Microbacterium sp. MYb62]PRB14478.1 hypothetical protein CQ042_11195 [Microbacterium sp. MYb62]
MARKLKAQGGPLDGRTVIVHETQKTFTHHGDTDGHYKVNEKSVTWQPNTKPAEETAPKTARTSKAKSAPKPQVPAPADAPVDQGAASAG